MKTKYALLTLCLLTLLAPMADAQTASSSGNNAAPCTPYAIVKVLAVINAGTVEVCIDYPSIVGASTSTALLAGSMSGPDNSLGVVFTEAWSIPTITGCTASALTTTTLNSAATTSSNTYATLTMTSNECHGILQMTLTAVTLPIMTWQRPFNLHVATIDNENRFCASSAFYASCTTPTLNAAITGSLTLSGGLTVTNAGGQSITITSWPQLNALLSGTLDVQDRLCNYSAFGAPCALPSIHSDSTSTVNIGNATVPNHLTVTVDHDQTVTTIGAWLPIGLFLLAIVWAEWSRTIPVYIMAVLVGLAAVLTLVPDLVGLRTSLIMAMLFVILRGFLVYQRPESTGSGGT